MEKIIDLLNDFFWNRLLIVALLGTGIYMSILLGFPQVRRFPVVIRQMFHKMFDKKPDSSGQITPFQALTTAVAAQVGTGNIVGVATAVAAGGPGAAFWMMLSAFFGMSTIFSEAVLAQKYREKKDGACVGGPAYTIKNGLHSNALAIFFAISCVFASMAIGVMVQSNAITGSVTSAFHLPPMAVVVVLMLVVFLILVGGIRRIARFAETVVPIMASLYILGTIFILIRFHAMIIPALQSIVVGAFHPESIGGGALGITLQHTIRFGLARGLFSNEAGMGSTPHSHAIAEVNHPAEQGFMAMLGVFISTFLICMSTVIANIVSGSYQMSIPASEMEQAAVLMTQKAFVYGFGPVGEMFISVCLSLFALTTIIGWYYFAESNVRFLFRVHPWMIHAFKLIVIALLGVGAQMDPTMVWKVADLFMALMVLPNILSLLLLSKQTKAILNDYERTLKSSTK